MTKLEAYIPPAAAAKPLSPTELLASLRNALTPWTPGTPFWIFAYGSLMWNPSFTFDVRHVATIRGYHRSFRVWSRINRGTPDKPGLVLPDETKLAAIIKAAPNKDLKAYVDNVTTAPLLEVLPTGGRVVKTTTKDAIGITEWELSNGVKVVLKPTTFREDEILFRATSPGGTSLASDDVYIPASTAAQLVNAGGLGKFGVLDLRKVLTG